VALDLPATMSGWRFVVPVRVDESATLHLMVDSGATRSMLSPEAARMLVGRGIARTLPGRTDVETGHGESVSLAELDTGPLRIGGHTAGPTRLLVGDVSALTRTAEDPMDGIAGLDLFRDRVLVMDYPGRSLRVEATGGAVPAGGFHAAWAGSSPVIELDLAGTPRRVLVDSGYGGALAMPEEGLPCAGAPVAVNALATVAGLRVTRAVRLVHAVELGGVVFERPVVDLLPAGPGLAGTEFLRRFVVRIDTAARTVALSPGRERRVTTPGLRSLGVLLSRTASGLRVEAVLPGGPAEGRLRRGDVVTRLDGREPRAWREELADLLASGRERVGVRFRRDGRSHDAELAVASQLE
jgi:hypothetical protein